MKRRMLSVILSLVMVLTLLPVTALAEDEADPATDIKYLDWDDDQKKLVEKICETATVVESSTSYVTWNAGWYVVNSSVTISNRITVSGDVHLILVDGYTLTASAGICVNEGNSFTIYGQSEDYYIEGKGDGILDPKGQATRAEAAAMLMRFLTRQMEE